VSLHPIQSRRVDKPSLTVPPAVALSQRGHAGTARSSLGAVPVLIPTGRRKERVAFTPQVGGGRHSGEPSLC
jgi:hypothetical protein